MSVNFDKWTFLKLVEVVLTVSCLICKRVTDDEASRLFLYLEKLSREWSLLNNVTWDRIGSAVADATYGGYVIITAALFIGRLSGELPTKRRITEIVFLLLGALLFVVLGSLELAALESVPDDLIDNAAVIGALSLLTAALFLLDLAGPRAKPAKPRTEAAIVKPAKQVEIKAAKPTEVYNIEKEMEALEKRRVERERPTKRSADAAADEKGQARNGGFNGQNGYKQMKDKPKRFDIYGKDYGRDSDESDGESTQEAEDHSPVWSKIRKGQYGKYDVVVPSFWYPKDHDDRDDRTPSTPGDPGYVQYTAKRWGQPQTQKTPRQSPTEV